MAADISNSRDTGLGRHQWFLARELERHGYRVRELYAQDVPAGGRGIWRRFLFPWAVLREARREQRKGTPYALALVHEGSAALLCFARRLGLMATPCVAVSHNPEQKVWERHLEFARRGLSPVRWWSRIVWPMTRLWQSNYALRHADRVLCLAEEDQRFIQLRYSLPRERIARITNGVEPHFFQQPPSHPEPRIVFLGSWLPHKGIHALRAALEAVLPKHPEASCSFLGVGVSEATALGEFSPAIRSRIVVRSHVPPGELPGILARHNIFVLPSWVEGMPLSLLEAMAAGLAVVVTDVGGMRDVVRRGMDGLRVPVHAPLDLAAALNRLCAEPALRSRLGRAAQERARSYTWAQAGETLADILHSVLAAPAAHPSRRTEARALASDMRAPK